MKSNSLSNIGISLAGAVSHNIGQIAVATLIMRDLDVIAYLPVLIVSGCVTGVFVGLVASFLEKGLRKANIFS
jgi:heptaprenyl diphosphate synthase